MASRASRSAPVDGFRLTFDRFGTPGAAPVVLLHGWPGTRHDYRRLVPLLVDADDADPGIGLDVIVPDLRGFGGSDKHAVSVSHFYSASAQAASVVGLIRELGLTGVVLAGYDVGSRVAQSVARMHADLVHALVLSPPLPGAGDRVLTAQAQSEFWYQAFHQLPLIDQLIDGNADAVRDYLRHFWAHWSGPDFTLSEDDLDLLVADYALPGAFCASIAWYRAGAGTIAQSLNELPPQRAIKIHAPPMCCRQVTIRCSRLSGPIGWSITSRMCCCTWPTAQGISHHWSAPSSSHGSVLSRARSSRVGG